MNAINIKNGLERISHVMAQNADYLIELDQRNGDGDLGIYMKAGFADVSAALNSSNESDLGRLLLLASRTLNESAPSSLGTILSVGLMGMAKALKGQTETDISGLADSMDAGLRLIMEKAGSKPGEKTVLDALYPGVTALKESGSFAVAAECAAKGSESTRAMRAVHGRASYYGDNSIGVLDGGSVVGRLIFEALAQKGAER